MTSFASRVMGSLEGHPLSLTMPSTLPLGSLEVGGQPQSAREPVKNNHDENRLYTYRAAYKNLG